MPVILRSRLRGFSRSALIRAVDRALRRLKLEHAELSLSVISEREMISANRRFFGKNVPTDVISSSQLEGAPTPMSRRAAGELLIGDVLVSIAAARAQSRDAGHPLNRELAILAVHGLLHNLGMDDQTPRERRAMMRKTLRILR